MKLCGSARRRAEVPAEFGYSRVATQRILGRTLSAHAMRHTWATRMIRSGRDLKAVSEYLGHESIQTIFLKKSLHSKRCRH